jgi:hypothetical protein
MVTITWFRSPDVKRDNVVLWILWALFSMERSRPGCIWEDEIKYISDIEGILGHKLESGYNHRVKSMGFTFDPVVTLHRPLVWYFVSPTKFFTLLAWLDASHQIVGGIKVASTFTRRY